MDKVNVANIPVHMPPAASPVQPPKAVTAAPLAIGLKPAFQLPQTAPQENAPPRAAPIVAPAASPGAPVAAVQPDPNAKPPFASACEVPTQEGPHGSRFDFNDGCRVVLPEIDKPWRVRLMDIDTGNVLFESELKAGRINSSKHYFVRFRIEIWLGGELVLTHDYSAKDQEVLVQLPVGTLGDTLGWFPYVERFQQAHGCRITCAMAEKLIPLFKETYPDVKFATRDDVKPDQYYATYNIGLFFDDAECKYQPSDFRLVGLHRTAGYILGVDPAELPARIALLDDTRPIAERYVCIAAQSSSQCKYWNNPTGWREVVDFLKQNGYRVICIDQKPTHGTGIVWNQIPYGVEDETGDRSLQERARWLKHADFFIGLSSGLSWLAWSVGVPVVLISGFTHPTNEFHTPYRVFNAHTCNSCWNDVRHRFNHSDYLWCPRLANTPRQFECTRLITAAHVKRIIETVPGFGEQVTLNQPDA